MNESVSNLVLRGPPFLGILLVVAGEFECLAMSARTASLVSELKAHTLLLKAIDARTDSNTRRLLAGRLRLKLECISLCIDFLLYDT